MIVRNVLCCHHGFFLWYLIMCDSPILKENFVKRICQRFQCIFSFDRLQFTFPNGDRVPAHSDKFMLNLQIPFLVPLYFVDPKLCIGFRYGTITTAFMPMPKATIHKDARSVFTHYDVRLARQPWMVEPIVEPVPPQPTTHHHLRLRVFRPDSRHILMAL